MRERLETISRLCSDFDSRTSYIKSKLGILVPSKIRALRLKSNMPRQRDLAKAAQMHQSRISMFETPGAANVTLETLAKLAAAFKVGLIVEFVPFSEMLRWENRYSQDTFDITRIDDDLEFITPEREPAARGIIAGHFNQTGNVSPAAAVFKPFAGGNTLENEQNTAIAALPITLNDRAAGMSRPQKQAAAGGE